ncbi:MAG: UDP-glucose/GDP-mannose dehydrogenase family protein [Burkholderiaceae bacterium]|nr:UDP-glucose/GDP-mannose dehydrogenase family protein [Burkholderiaceae bacterium]
MNIAIVGTGHLGLVVGACLASNGNHVCCIDHNIEKTQNLNAGHLPFHEPGLTDLVSEGRQQGLLCFTHDLAAGIKNAELIFLAIGVPATDYGRANLNGLLSCAKQLSPLLQEGAIVVIASTVPPGTCELLHTLLNKARPAQQAGAIHVAANPQFLSAGHAITDFQRPTRVVIGSPDTHVQQVLETLYEPCSATGAPVLVMDTRTAEFAKYACSAMLATRITMMNELASMAGQMQASVAAMRQVIDLEPGLRTPHPQPSAGYGGPHLPADLLALIKTAQDVDEPAYLLRSVERANHRQGRLLFEAILQHFSHVLRGRRLAVWGLSYAPGTDDVRQAPSIRLITQLLEAGARVQAYDPVASDQAQQAIANHRLAFAPTAYAACAGADALVVMTAGEEFRHPDFAMLAKLLNTAAVFDASTLYDTDTVNHHGLQHYPLWQKRQPVLQQPFNRVNYPNNQIADPAFNNREIIPCSPSRHDQP